MIQLPWAALTSSRAEPSDARKPDWLRAEIEQRLQLGDTLLVTDIPPAGEARSFDQLASFRRWLFSRPLAR